MPRIEINYSIDSGLSISIASAFQDCHPAILSHLRGELMGKKEVCDRLRKRGISDENEMLREYLICFYGGNDTKMDIDNEKSTPDYCHCGNRGFCPDEGFPGLCSLPKIGDVELSRSEIKVLQLLANDYSVKEVANVRHRSPHTVGTQDRTIRKKFNVRSTSAAIAIAARERIV